MADRLRQVRNLILKLADENPEAFRHGASGKVNEAAFARAIGLNSASTIHRILRGQRNVDAERDRVRRVPPGDYEPSQRLLAGLRDVMRMRYVHQVIEELEHIEEPRPDDPSAALWGT